MKAYYYNKMNKIQQNVYYAMNTGLMALAPFFSVPRLEVRELQDKIDDGVKRAEQAARKGTVLIFHWRGDYLNRERLSELLELLEQAAMKRAGISVQV